MLHVFDADSVFFTVPWFDYPMSYLEFFGTLLNLTSVILVAKRNVLTWPVGIAAVCLFSILFYQIRLYADFFEQLFYVTTGFWGWIAWTRIRSSESISIGSLSPPEATVIAAGLIIGSVAVTVLLLNIHRLLPDLFPDQASYPAVDAATTVGSFMAQYLLIRRKWESWLIWIAVDVAAIWLYWVKDVPFVSILYAVFLILAIRGLLQWRKSLVSSSESSGLLTEVTSI